MLKNKNLNSKFEYLNPKQILNSNFPNSKPNLFETLGFKIWDLFRISDFGFRILSICVLLCIFCICFAQEQFVYDAKGKRDPFIPLVTPDGRLLKLEKEETDSGLLLEGIIYDEHGLSYAIVNGEVVRVSDKSGDYQVLKIEKNKVIFIKGGQTLEVKLKEEELP